MHIGEVAARTELSLRTLRHYDEIGLLRPSGRSDGGFRLYTEEDVERLLVIRRMKPLGYSLDQMIDVMRLVDVLADPQSPADDRDAARKALKDTRDDAQARRVKLERQLGMADEFLGLLDRQLSG